MVGNLPNYKEEDVLRTFLYIEDKPVSRAELMKNLELGEGTIRTILNLLKEKKLLRSNRPGHFLSGKGKKIKENIMEELDGPKKLALKEYKGMKSSGLLVKNPGKKKINLDLRDEAIRAGAYSSILFIYDNNLKIPFLDYEYKKNNPNDYNHLINNFNLEKNNILIVTFAINHRTSENSALAVMKKIKKINLF
ncbi:DUF4443 domain-containing protein [Candidatus Woesearchaeota archaeon]|nr:DUF4443 domain-containing protein [Candidatus Woesearchaeota archaeon]